MIRKPRLTDLDLVLLSNAANRPDGMLLPPPESLRGRGKTLEKTLAKLLRLSLVEEAPALAPDQAWRQDDDGRGVALRISAAGCEALGLDEDPVDVKDTAAPEIAPSKAMAAPVAPANTAKPEDAVEAGTPAQAPPAAASVKPGTKQARLVDHLSGPSGASIADLGGLLGWQPHTVRAALSGLRKKGYQISSTKDAAGVAVYRVMVEAIDDAA